MREGCCGIVVVLWAWIMADVLADAGVVVDCPCCQAVGDDK